ncbi:hypothetical protein [Maritimibacter alexandrii]|uniref:hypothetical protein n=1 Tax=Maritimibacter alexandrii TaxID=2570355 RepID=UPI0011085659|nr:hypothetical protein [Maritimibacter alexandrii]
MGAPDPARETSPLSGVALPLAVLAVSVIGAGAILLWPEDDPAPAVAPFEAARDCDAAEQVQFEGKVFCPGTPIEVFKYAGIDTVAHDGATYRIVVDAGRTGTILGHAPSPVNGTPSVARILWDAQEWPLEDGGTAMLPAFEETTHADHLRLRR